VVPCGKVITKEELLAYEAENEKRRYSYRGD